MGKLYTLFDTDLSDIHVKYNNFQQLQFRAKAWLEVLPTSSPVSEILKKNINNNLEDSRVKYAQNLPLTPLQFDIQILRTVTKEIENSRKFGLLDEFKNSVQTIFNNYAEQGTALLDITKNMPSTFSNFIEGFVDQSNAVVNAFNSSSHINILREAGSLANIVQGFNVKGPTISQISNHLFQQTFSIVNKNLNFNASFDSKKFTTNPSLEVIGQGFKLFTNFLGINDPNAARQIAAVGQAAVSIDKHLLM